jgi:hypothetical protein
MNERERRAAELVSCVSAGCLLLIGAASCLAGACVRWPSASKTAGVIVLAAAACLSSVWIGKKKKDMSKIKQLEPICWVSRPNELAREIGEEYDLCRLCAEKRVEKYRAEFPSYSNEIGVGGGNEYDHNSDGPAMCVDCGEPLACWVIPTQRSLLTLEQWNNHP